MRVAAARRFVSSAQCRGKQALQKTAAGIFRR